MQIHSNLQLLRSTSPPVMRNSDQAIFSRKMAHSYVGLLVMFLILGTLAPQTVFGHAELLSSTPSDGENLDSSPPEVVLDFSEPVGLVDGGTTLHSDGAEPLELSPQVSGSNVTIPLDLLEDGAYIVQWRVISADAHPISGTISFAVGDAEVSKGTVVDELPGWLEWSRSAAVGIKYFGLLSALGMIVVGWVIARRDLATVTTLSGSFAAVGLLGILIELPLAAAIQQGATSPSISGLWVDLTILQSNTLIAAITAAILVVLALTAIWVPLHANMKWRISTGLLAGAVLTLILNGHSRTREPAWLMMFSDAIHATVAAIWLGGIILLVLGISGRWRGQSFSGPGASAIAVSRFSTIGGYTAAVVAVSGVVMGILILNSPEALYRTDYGVSLLIKFGLVAAVVVLAAINRFALIPRLTSDSTRSLARLRRLVTWELVLLIAVVAVTGHLVHQDPNVAVSTPVQSASTTLYEGEESLDSDHTVRMNVQVSPENQVTVVATIIDEERDIVLPDTDLQLSWYLPDQDLGPISQSIPIDTATGAYNGIFMLPATGDWELEVQVRIDRFTDSRTTVSIVVPD